MEKFRWSVQHTRDDYADYKQLIKEKRQPVGLHHHEYYELLFFLSGDLEYHVEQNVYQISPRDILLISPTELHQPIFFAGTGFYERVVLWIQPEVLTDLAHEPEDLSLCFNGMGTNRCNLLHPSQDKFHHLLNLLSALQNTSNSFYNTASHALLSLIMVQINILCQEQTVSARAQGHVSEYTALILQYIAQHINQPILLSDISEQCHICQQHMLRLFKADMSISIHKYITQKRLLTAHQYLKEGKTASEASALTGFSSYSSFWRAYKKEYGIAPRKK